MGRVLTAIAKRESSRPGLHILRRHEEQGQPPAAGTQHTRIYHRAAPGAVSDLYSLNPYLHFNFVTACTQTQITLLSQDVLTSKVAHAFSPGI